MRHGRYVSSIFSRRCKVMTVLDVCIAAWTTFLVPFSLPPLFPYVSQSSHRLWNPSFSSWLASLL